MAFDRDHVVLSHEGRCPQRDGEEIRVKIYLRRLTEQEQIQFTRKNRRRGYRPPQFVKERCECPHRADCEAVREDAAACPVYREYGYFGFVE